MSSEFSCSAPAGTQGTNFTRKAASPHRPRLVARPYLLGAVSASNVWAEPETRKRSGALAMTPDAENGPWQGPAKSGRRGPRRLRSWCQRSSSREHGLTHLASLPSP